MRLKRPVNKIYVHVHKIHSKKKPRGEYFRSAFFFSIDNPRRYRFMMSLSPACTAACRVSTNSQMRKSRVFIPERGSYLPRLVPSLCITSLRAA